MNVSSRDSTLNVSSKGDALNISSIGDAMDVSSSNKLIQWRDFECKHLNYAINACSADKKKKKILKK